MTSNHLVRHDNQIQQFPLPWALTQAISRAYTSYFQWENTMKIDILAWVIFGIMSKSAPTWISQIDK